MISIISGFASLIGAGIAIWQARNAIKAAEFVEKIKNRLEDQRVSNELSKLYYSIKDVRKVLSKYGPAANEISLRGTDSHKDAQELQNFLSLLREHRNTFKNENKEEIDSFCDDLSSLTEKLVDAKDFENMREVGTNILNRLDNFTAKIKTLINKKEKEIIDISFKS